MRIVHPGLYRQNDVSAKTVVQLLLDEKNGKSNSAQKLAELKTKLDNGGRIR